MFWYIRLIDNILKQHSRKIKISISNWFLLFLPTQTDILEKGDAQNKRLNKSELARDFKGSFYQNVKCYTYALTPRCTWQYTRKHQIAHFPIGVWFADKNVSGSLCHRGIPAQRRREGGGKRAGPQWNRCLNTGKVRVEVQQILELRSTYILTWPVGNR